MHCPVVSAFALRDLLAVAPNPTVVFWAWPLRFPFLPPADFPVAFCESFFLETAFLSALPLRAESVVPGTEAGFLAPLLRGDEGPAAPEVSTSPRAPV